MKLVEHLQNSIKNGDLKNSKIDKSVLDVEGMSSPKIRHFLNNVVNFPTCRYLEVGCWKGSTIISAMFKNQPERYWVVDNFKEFGNVKEEMLKNFTSIVGYPPNLIDKDFLSFQPYDGEGMSDVNVYLYDGAHADECHRQSLLHYQKSLANEFIFIVDDWNWTSVAAAIRNAIKELNLTTLFEKELPAKQDGQDLDQWWNGFFVAVLKKPNE